MPQGDQAESTDDNVSTIPTHPLNPSSAIESAIRVSPHDVILGKGRAVTEHAGNSRFRELVQRRMPDYFTMRQQSRKGIRTLASQLVATVKQQQGRFLCMTNGNRDVSADDMRSLNWTQVTDDAAIQKTLQLFRDLAKMDRTKMDRAAAGKSTHRSQKRTRNEDESDGDDSPSYSEESDESDDASESEESDHPEDLLPARTTKNPAATPIDESTKEATTESTETVAQTEKDAAEQYTDALLQQALLFTPPPTAVKQPLKRPPAVTMFPTPNVGQEEQSQTGQNIDQQQSAAASAPAATRDYQPLSAPTRFRMETSDDILLQQHLAQFQQEQEAFEAHNQKDFMLLSNVETDIIRGVGLCGIPVWTAGRGVESVGTHFNWRSLSLACDSKDQAAMTPEKLQQRGSINPRPFSVRTIMLLEKIVVIANRNPAGAPAPVAAWFFDELKRWAGSLYMADDLRDGRPIAYSAEDMIRPNANARSTADDRVDLLHRLDSGDCWTIIVVASNLTRLRCIWERANLGALVAQANMNWLIRKQCTTRGLEVLVKSDIALLENFLRRGYAGPELKRCQWLVEQLHFLLG